MELKWRQSKSLELSNQTQPSTSSLWEQQTPNRTQARGSLHQRRRASHRYMAVQLARSKLRTYHCWSMPQIRFKAMRGRSSTRPILHQTKRSVTSSKIIKLISKIRGWWATKWGLTHRKFPWSARTRLRYRTHRILLRIHPKWWSTIEWRWWSSRAMENRVSI